MYMYLHYLKHVLEKRINFTFACIYGIILHISPRFPIGFFNLNQLVEAILMGTNNIAFDPINVFYCHLPIQCAIEDSKYLS